MDDLLVQEKKQELVMTLHHAGAELPMPFERDIYLLGVTVAGTTYAPNIETLFASLKEGDRVKLVREPDNPYDEYAIRIDTENDETIGYLSPEAASAQGPEGALALEKSAKLGYIPRYNNKIFARLMDAGKLLYGVVRAKEAINTYHKIMVNVYLKD